MGILTKKDYNDRIICVMEPYVISENSELCNKFPIIIIEKKSGKLLAEFNFPHSFPKKDFFVEDLIDKDKDAINEYFAKSAKENQIEIEKTAEELADVAAKFNIA